MQNKNIKIYIAGHRGMVGSAIQKTLRAQGYSNVVTKTHVELDLTNQKMVEDFFYHEKPDHVYIAAAKVGGIYANNNYPADFIYENLMIEANIIHSAFKNGVKKLLFLGSSCIYPKLADQPMKESALLSGKLEPTNEPYAIAKIAGIKLCESYNRQYKDSHGLDYRSVMPTNLYGPGDNYHSLHSHVIPALIKRFHEAKINNYPEVIIWGTGQAKREFLFVDDMAKASIHVMQLSYESYNTNILEMQSHINIGSGDDVTIKFLAELISKVVNYKGIISYDSSKSDGAPRKLMDNGLIRKLGWVPEVTLEDGLQTTYNDFLNNKNSRI